MNPKSSFTRLHDWLRACSPAIRAIAFALVTLAVPALAHAQASIVGVVKDSSGAVIPGVTVEASSPALIEKVRAVITDGGGNYQIVDLRPGVYSVDFSLPGFTSVKRDGTFAVETSRTTVKATTVQPGAPPGRYKVAYHPPSDGQKVGGEYHFPESIVLEAKENTLTLILPDRLPVTAANNQGDAAKPESKRDSKSDD